MRTSRPLADGGESLVHSWLSGWAIPDLATSAEHEQWAGAAGFDWAICAPLPEDPLPGWALYITGQTMQPLPQPERSIDSVKKEDLKFAGLVADIFGALRQVRDLQKRKSILEISTSCRTAGRSERYSSRLAQPGRSTTSSTGYCSAITSTRIATSP